MSHAAAPILSWPARVRLAAADIKLAHSVFALPFALFAVFLARPADAPSLTLQLTLVVACMVLARTFAMLVNRLADRRFDADNPRTARRAFAAGRLRPRDGLLLAALCALLFQLTAALFWFLLSNPWPAALALPVLAFLALYSFSKRFTTLCHLFLGAALAASPIAAALAINPHALTTVPSLWWLAAMVLLWVAGFDIIYALADLAFDRARGLRSIPQRLGWRGAIWTSRALHAGALACLVMVARADPRLDLIFASGVFLAAALLLAEHIVLARRGLAGLPIAFFTFNGILSLALGAAGIANLLWP